MDLYKSLLAYEERIVNLALKQAREESNPLIGVLTILGEDFFEGLNNQVRVTLNAAYTLKNESLTNSELEILIDSSWQNNSTDEDIMDKILGTVFNLKALIEADPDKVREAKKQMFKSQVEFYQRILKQEGKTITLKDLMSPFWGDKGGISEDYKARFYEVIVNQAIRQEFKTPQNYLQAIEELHEGERGYFKLKRENLSNRLNIIQRIIQTKHQLRYRSVERIFFLDPPKNS